MQPQQQQPYPPQGYPQQQYAPQPYPQQQPTQYAPQQPAHGGPFPQGADQFNSPAPTGGARPRIHDIGAGRLLLVTPVKIERGLPNKLSDNPGATQDRITVDIAVLDGPPFAYGGDPENFAGKGAIPHMLQATPPQEWLSMWITNTVLIQQLERSIGGRMVLGRLTQGVSNGPGRRPPWRLDDPTDADRQAARDFLRAKEEGRIVSPQQQQAAQAYVAGPPQSTYVPLQQQFTPQAPPAPAAAQLDISTPPPGWDPVIWAQLPPEQRQMIVAASSGRPGI